MHKALNQSTFPPDFAWGVAIGVHQTEGGNIASDWWYRENQPDSAVAERCGDAVDGYHRWRLCWTPASTRSRPSTSRTSSRL